MCKLPPYCTYDSYDFRRIFSLRRGTPPCASRMRATSVPTAPGVTWP